MKSFVLTLLLTFCALPAPACADDVIRQQIVKLVQGAASGVLGVRATVAVAPNGRAIVAWTEQTFYSMELWYAVVDPQGAFLTLPTPILGPYGSVREVKTSASSLGFAVAWESEPANQPLRHEVWYATFSLSGNPGPAGVQRANMDSSTSAVDPDVACNPDGSFVVAWARHSVTPNTVSQGIHARAFTASGAALMASEVRVDDVAMNFGAQRGVSIATWPNGHAVIVWQDGVSGASPASGSAADADGSAILGRWFQPGLVPAASGVLVLNTMTGGDQQSPYVAADLFKSCVVGWTGPAASGQSEGWLRRFDDLGIGIGNSEAPLPATVEWGGLLGTAIVQEVGKFGCEGLYARGGRIPAPMQGYRN